MNTQRAIPLNASLAAPQVHRSEHQLLGCGAVRRAVSPHAQSNTTTVVLGRRGCGTKSATRIAVRQAGQIGTSVERLMTFDARGFRATRFSAQASSNVTRWKGSGSI